MNNLTWIGAKYCQRCSLTGWQWCHCKPKQDAMFNQGEDLPLISQTPQKAKIEAFKPKNKAHQTSMFSCPACKDTGKIGNKKCWCEASRKV